MTGPSTQQATAAAIDRGLVSPLAETIDQGLTAAPRLSTLRGKTVGLLDNRKGNGDRLLADIGALLKERYDIKDIHYATKFVYARRATPEVLDDMAEHADFVVTAIGD